MTIKYQPFLKADNYAKRTPEPKRSDSDNSALDVKRKVDKRVEYVTCQLTRYIGAANWAEREEVQIGASAVIKDFKDKGLEELFLRRTTAKIGSSFHAGIIRRLDALNAAGKPEDMRLPGYNFHPLKGYDPTRYSVHVNGPWCITYEFSLGDAFRVDFLQYH